MLRNTHLTSAWNSGLIARCGRIFSEINSLNKALRKQNIIFIGSYGWRVPLWCKHMVLFCYTYISIIPYMYYTIPIISNQPVALWLHNPWLLLCYDCKIPPFLFPVIYNYRCLQERCAVSGRQRNWNWIIFGRAQDIDY